MYPYGRGFIPRSFGGFSPINNNVSNIISNINKTIPFSTPKALATAATKTTKSLSLSSILSGAQKGINTLNQIIPLYNQVKPLIQNGRAMLNIFKKVKNTDFEPEGQENTSQSDSNEIINEIEKENTKISKSNTKDEKSVIINQTQPSKPFFV